MAQFRISLRHYHRCARKITICFSTVAHAAYLPGVQEKLHVQTPLGGTTVASPKMADGVVGLLTMLVLGPMFLWVAPDGTYRLWRWKRQLIQQRRVHAMYELVRKRLAKVFWKGAGDTVV